MNKLMAVVVASGMTLGGVALAAPAQAASSNVGGWTAGTVTCANGAVSVFPVVVANGSAGPRTGSYTVPGYISAAVQVASSPSGINCNGGSYNGDGLSANFSVPSEGVTVMWVGLGSASTQTYAASHNIGFGGLPSGTRGASWYDLGLTLNNATTAINGGNTFNNLTATYQYTGGLDLTTNNQDGFVITNCTTTNDGSILPGPSVLTPFNNGAWTSGPSYGANQPLCAAWAPEGTYVGYTQGSSTDFSIQAAQSYGDNGLMMAVAGDGSAPITSASFTTNYNTYSMTTSLPINAPQSGPWLGQDPESGDWFIANMNIYQYSTTVTLNGQTVGTVN